MTTTAIYRATARDHSHRPGAAPAPLQGGLPPGRQRARSPLTATWHVHRDGAALGGPALSVGRAGPGRATVVLGKRTPRPTWRMAMSPFSGVSMQVTSDGAVPS